MASYRAVAAKVAESKRLHPDQFCPVARCLWRTGGGRCPRHPAPAAGPSAYVLAEAKRLGTACGCCDAIDDPNGPGPAINTGFCDACNAAGCREQTINQPCAAASGKAGR